jgi:hypothetical protein
MTDPEEPIACTLDGRSFQERIAAIRALAARGLIDHRRDGRQLRLRFDPAVAGEVEELVRLERACCAWLSFDLHRSNTTLELTITAPPGAEDAMPEIHAVFAVGPSQDCGCA